MILFAVCDSHIFALHIAMESNPIIEEMLNKNPLVVFSIYTDIQNRTVRELGKDILKSVGWARAKRRPIDSLDSQL